MLLAPLMALMVAAPDPAAGEVVLPLPEFNRLVDLANGASTPAVTPPPVPASVRQARYKVVASGAQARVQMVATVDVLGDRPVMQPLLGSASALLAVKVDGKPAAAQVQDEFYAVSLPTGTHEVDVTVAVPVAREGPSELHLSVPEAVTASLVAELPGKGWQVQVEGVAQPRTTRGANQTTVSTALPVTGALSLSWVRQDEAGGGDDEEGDPGEEEPPPAANATPGKARAQVFHHLAVEEAILRGTVRVNLSVQKGTRSSLTVTLPENVDVLDVQAADLREWTANKDGGLRHVLVHFKYGRTGEVPVTIRYERPLKDAAEKTALAVPEPIVLDVEGERAFLGIESAPGVEVALARTEGAEALDGRDLPADLWSMSSTPLVLGVKYLEHPVRVELGISQRAKVAVADTTLDRATFETVVNTEGRAVSAVNWYVRNHQRQYLEVTLPGGAQVLSCFVNGKPVRPARGAADALFIPLDRSTAAEGQGAAFPVELVLAQQAGNLRGIKDLDLVMPGTGVQAMELSWRVYVPATFTALGFGGNFAVANDPRGMHRWLAGAFTTQDARAGGGSLDLRSKSAALEGYDMTQGVKARWAAKARSDENQAATAVRLSRPLVGRAYDFHANLLRAEAPRVSLLLVRREALSGAGGVSFLMALLGAGLLCEMHRRRTGAYLPAGVDADPTATLRPGVRGSTYLLAGGLVLSALVGLYVDDVVVMALLGVLVGPTWLVAWHLRSTLRRGTRKRGWPIYAFAVMAFTWELTAALAQSLMGTLVMLGMCAALSLLARRLMWGAAATTSPPSGTPVSGGATNAGSGAPPPKQPAGERGGAA